jgi:RNA polymerase sigma-70 factor (ECF subfamily)
MPVELREVIILRDMERFSYAQVAQIIGCPAGTVKSRLHAARTRLRVAARAWQGECDE